MAGLYIWSPILWHAVYHKPAVYILYRGHGVIINSNQYKIGNNQKMQIKGNCWAWNTATLRLQISCLCVL